MPNQNPEQLARDLIDSELLRSGWLIQNKNQINLNAATGVVIREYQTDIGPADYVLFINKLPVGIIEAKRVEEGVHLTMHEDQTEGYRTAKLKFLHKQPLFFGYESTGEVTRFTDFRDPKLKATGGQWNVKVSTCREIPFPFCSVEDQNEIIQEIESRLSVADKMEESITQSLQQAEALRQGILKKAFEGKLV